ncbi:uncharacterized protein LOC144884728 [Branchiostoma floridae x Branchiostoma japonicum]
MEGLLSAGGWVETDPTWVTPDEWVDGDGVRRVAGYVLDSNVKTAWRRGDDERSWQLTFDLQTSMTLSRIRMSYGGHGDRGDSTGDLGGDNVDVGAGDMGVKVLRLERREWEEVTHNIGRFRQNDKIKLFEIDLTGLLATAQSWRLQFPRGDRREISEVKFFQACSGVERTVCTDGDCDVHEVICDGIVDCDDGSDENNCDKEICSNGATFNKTQVCDGSDDCGDGTDEQNCCEQQGLMTCSDGQCAEMQKYCAQSHIPCFKIGTQDAQYSTCDDEEDCSDGSDESNCPVSTCENGALFHSATRCDGKDDCGDNSDEQHCVCYYLRDRGTSYRGRANRDNSCQFWASQYPHTHNHTPQAYQRAGLERNYCRNPDGKDRPWCYTNNPLIRWMYCDDVFACDAPPTRCFYAMDKGRSYAGPVNRAGDRVCQRWDSQSPHSHPHTPQAHPDAGLEENFCRNPDNKERPWCYTTDPTRRWDYCNVMECADPFSEDYIGQVCKYADDNACENLQSLCYCDSDCSFFGDCCNDFNEPALRFTAEEFRVLPNGSVHLLSSNVSCPAEQVAILNTTASICGECISAYFSNHTQTTDHRDPHQGWLTLGLVVVSALAVFAFVVHTFTSGQVKKFPEKLKVQMMICMALAESLFVVRVFIPLGEACVGYAIILHFFLLSAFTSMNALAIDLFLTFRDGVERPVLKNYMLYTWLIPALVVVTTVIVEYSSSVRVGYGENCWIGNPTANLVAFGVPVLCALLVNAVLITFVLLAIRKSFKIADAALSRSNSIKAWVYVRISFLMGLTWLLGFIYPYVNSSVLDYIFIVLNASQGLLLALTLTLTSEVMQKWKTAIRERFGLAEPKQNNGATATTNSRRTIRGKTEVTSGGADCATDIPMTTFADVTDVEKNRAPLQLGKGPRDRKRTATASNRRTIRGKTEVTSGGMDSATDIPMVTFADVKENRAPLQLGKAARDREGTATTSNRRIIDGKTSGGRAPRGRDQTAAVSNKQTIGGKPGGTDSASDIPMTTLADVEEDRARLQLSKAPQDRDQTAAASNQQTIGGKTDVTSGGSETATDIPMAALSDVDERTRLQLDEAPHGNGRTATASNQQTTVTTVGTDSTAEVPMTIFATVDVNRACLHLEEGHQDSGLDATASNLQTSVGETETTAGEIDFAA